MKGRLLNFALVLFELLSKLTVIALLLSTF